MAESITLSAKARAGGAGRGPARAVRREGRVPGVIYAEGKPPTMITVDPQQLSRELVKPGFFARLVDVELDGSKVRVLPREVQLDPVSDRPVHVDLLRVTAGTRIRVNIPVRFLNPEASPGIRRGGILNVVRHEIEMLCPADKIPSEITVNLDDLEIGDSIHINQVKLPDGVKPTLGRNFTVASVTSPTAVREEAAAAAA
ncbi:MAG: 50S ribosomal protein L25/general stress protein Ctc, partial [Alphaproteobacteria bacterium]|nr:50S ribosomal protein L25/general stress protein Ctc [Alphaproteobacteria bacterium]